MNEIMTIKGVEYYEKDGIQRRGTDYNIPRAL